MALCIANACSFVFLAKFFVGSWSTLSRLELGADEGNNETAEAKSCWHHCGAVSRPAQSEGVGSPAPNKDLRTTS